MSSDDEDYVIIQSPSSDIMSLPSLSSVPSRTPTPTPVQTVSRTIHDLEDNVMATIFRALSSVCKPFVAYGGYYDFGFILASHVCVRWRVIILACPDLWTGHVFAFPNHHAVLAILERTRNLPLDVKFTFDSASQPMTTWRSSLCLNLLPRTRTLEFSIMHGAVSRTDFHGLLTAIVAQGAPTLESLTIDQFDLRAPDRSLYVELFAPNLCSLRLDGIFFPCLSRTLTTVQVKLARSLRNANDVLGVLRSAADTLENVLIDVVPDYYPYSVAQSHAFEAFREDVHLPNAKVIAFRGRDAGLLDSLRTPPETFFSLSLTSALGHVAEAMDDIFLSRVKDLLSWQCPCTISLNTVHEPARMSILSLPPGGDVWHEQALTLVERSVEFVHGLHDHMSHRSTLPTQAAYPGLSIEWPDHSIVGRGEGQQLGTLLNPIRFAIESSEGNLFRSVRCLDISVPDDLLSTEWKQLLQGFTAVDTLRMHIASTILLATLATHTSTLLPNLTTLVVVLDGMDDSKDHIEYHQPKLSAQRLTGLVIAYLEAGRENIIEFVRLEGKPESRLFAETMRERLGAYVPRVEVMLD
ncbi:unnamed protein product [Peniophora sp. CBMAI 1063]|nr:unnamed protein product [Peniophora sp. CBMAI 1063]